LKSLKVSFKSGQCGGGILETDELYSEPNEDASTRGIVEIGTNQKMDESENGKITSLFDKPFYQIPTRFQLIGNGQIHFSSRFLKSINLT